MGGCWAIGSHPFCNRAGCVSPPGRSRHWLPGTERRPGFRTPGARAAGSVPDRCTPPGVGTSRQEKAYPASTGRSGKCVRECSSDGRARCIATVGHSEELSALALRAVGAVVRRLLVAAVLLELGVGGLRRVLVGGAAVVDLVSEAGAL